jgi:hypothetical protein
MTRCIHCGAAVDELDAPTHKCPGQPATAAPTRRALHFTEEERHRQEAARECEAIAMDFAERWSSCRAETLREMECWQKGCTTVAREIRRRFGLPAV